MPNKSENEKEMFINSIKDAVDKGFKEGIGLIKKGGPGSGNFGHEGRPGEVGGSGEGGGETSKQTISIAPDKVFIDATLPLRGKLKFDDAVVYMDENKNPVVGSVTYGGKDVNPKTHIAVKLPDGKVEVVPREHLRMPKGGHRTRGE